jgi:hypothetical protein
MQEVRVCTLHFWVELTTLPVMNERFACRLFAAHRHFLTGLAGPTCSSPD